MSLKVISWIKWLSLAFFLAGSLFMAIILVKYFASSKSGLFSHLFKNDKHQSMEGDFSRMTSQNGSLSSESGENPNNILRVLQLNTWVAGNWVNDGFKKIAEHIARLDPDIVLLQEMKPERLQELLKELGPEWDGVDGGGDMMVLTKHKMLKKKRERVRLSPATVGTKIHLPNHNLTVNAISAHLPHSDYGPYLYHFGNSTTVEKASTVVEKDVQPNGRLHQIKTMMEHPFFQRSLKRSKEGREALIIGGDFNEPSHLDWTEEAKEMNGGFSFEWPVTKELEQAGLLDSFRQMHPSVVENPGDTWSPIYKLAKEGDREEPQDRIDFIFYHQFPRLQLLSSFNYMGDPALSRLMPDHEDNHWPSDHLAVVTDFKVLDAQEDGMTEEKTAEEDEEEEMDEGVEVVEVVEEEEKW